MLMNFLRVLINNSFKENFYLKKKTINVLTIFFLFPVKVVSKIFQNKLLTNAFEHP